MYTQFLIYLLVMLVFPEKDRQLMHLINTLSFSETNIKNESFIPSKISEIPLPQGFKRINTDEGSFARYLQNLPLNTSDNKIYSYDGSIISTGGYHYAIVDLDIGTKNLQQCADAVIRLRAEYLYSKKRFSEIHFNFVSDGKPRYYKDYCKADTSYRKFRQYLDFVFSYANTSSLCDEMKTENFVNIQIGDVFVQKGHPVGHAVIIVDMALNIKTGEKIMLIAESFMPAQSIHILLNQQSDDMNPWYLIDSENPLVLPTWTFYKKDLRRFK
ncbi:MAG: DUF4846 domain-containing protein [Bacteroidales bacterium]